MSVIEYSYDVAGNRTQKVEGGVTTTYVYDTANQLVSSQTGSTLTTYLYDLNGNLLSETTGSSVTSYEWDEENRLTKVNYPDGSSETYTYSADGLRKKKVVTSSANVNDTTLFLWDGQNIVLETDENNTVQARYTSLPHGYGKILSQLRESNLNYGFDTRGNTRILVNASNIIAANYDYSGYGEEQGVTGAMVNPHRFGGEVGYYSDKPFRVYVRARHYQPQLARWMSEDPLAFQGDSTNFYRYGRNNPVNYLDPSGLFPPPVPQPLPTPTPIPIKPMPCVCGPEMGQRIYNLLDAVERTYNRDWSKVQGKRRKMCEGLYNPAAGLVFWDIINLHSRNYANWIGAFHPKCGLGKCAETVSLYGQCNRSAEVNYLLWGRINKLCQTTFPMDYSMTRAIHQVVYYKLGRKIATYLWKRPDLEGLQETLLWVRLGYQKSKRPLPTDTRYSKCKPCGQKFTRPLVARWGNSYINE